jgi:uncharacterized protein YbaP (TraB family)
MNNASCFRHPAVRAAAFVLIVAATLLGGARLAIARADQQPPPPEQLDEVVVSGERPGPGMWHVRHGSAQVWILGSLSPLPKNITWRSHEVEQVLEITNQVLVPKPLELGIVKILWLLVTERNLLMVRGGKRLKDVMASPLYARFAAQRAKYTGESDKWERYRPIIAAAFLQHAAFHQVGLSARVDLGAAVRILAKNHGVRVDEVKIGGMGDLLEALKTMQNATENICVEASLGTIETGLPRLLDRATAWATGNVERIESMPEPADVDACLEALDAGTSAGDLLARVRRSWFEALDKSLQGNASTLAVVNIDMLLGHGGLLEELRAKGYEVVAP